MSDRNEKMKELQDEMRLLKEQLLRISERLEETAEEEPTQPKGTSVEAEPEEAPQSAEAHEYREEDDDEPYSPRHRRYRPPKPPGPEWGDRLGDYISEFVDDVMEGVTSELERSLFTEPGYKRDRPTVLTDSEVARIAAVMNAMANEHRIKILKELTWGGMYAGDLQERLQEISPSTLSSHLDNLQDAGLIVQERRRGRYLVTMNGRIAIKMAAAIAKRAGVRFEPGDLD